MNLAVRIILVAVLFSIPLKGSAQGNAEIVEELKRLAGEIADLREANTAQNRRMTQMQKEILLRLGATGGKDMLTHQLAQCITLVLL